MLIPEALRHDIQRYVTPDLYIGFGTVETGRLTVAPPALVRRVPGVVGFALPGRTIEVVDDDDQPLAAGLIGRLRVRAPGMIDAYLEDAEETATRFRDGWYYPADLGALTPDGALIHHGRADDLMIVNGINIYPGEIESAFLRHPAVAEAAAFSLKDPVRGDLPAVAVVATTQISSEELQVHCRHWLGSKSPRAVLFVGKLPRNAAGKVVKRELVARYMKQLAAQPAAPQPSARQPSQ